MTQELPADSQLFDGFHLIMFLVFRFIAETNIQLDLIYTIPNVNFNI